MNRARRCSSILVAALALLACHGSLEGPEGDAARSLRRYLTDGRRADLETAGSLLRQTLPGPVVWGPSTAPSLSTAEEFLHAYTSWLLCPVDERPRVFPDRLFAAVLAELEAQPVEVVRYLLLHLWFDGARDGDMASRKAFVYVLFNCARPARHAWAKPDDIVAFMGLRRGDAVVDVGSGPGYFTFRFARVVGPAGRVLATELNPFMIDFVQREAKAEGLTNVETVLSPPDAIGVPDASVDRAFMTQMFLDIEGIYGLEHRRKLYGSVLHALRPGGTFTVCEPPNPAFPGLTAAQMADRLVAYGFRVDGFPAADSPLNATYLCARVARP